MAFSSVFKSVNLRQLRVEAFFVNVFGSNREWWKNGSGNILDFRVDISYPCSSKEKNVKNLYASLR